MGLGCIPNDTQIVFGGKGLHGRHIDRIAEEMDRGDGRGFFGNAPGGVLEVDQVGVGIHITNDRHAAGRDDHAGGGNEGEGRDQDFLSGFQEGGVGQLQGGRAVGAGQPMLGADRLGELPFKGLALGALTQAARAQYRRGRRDFRFRQRYFRHADHALVSYEGSLPQLIAEMVRRGGQPVWTTCPWGNR